MIKCPKCQSTLPDWATTCQFCGSSVSGVVRPPADPESQKVYAYGPAPWVWVVYYLIGGWWVASGLFDIVRGLIAKEELWMVDCVFAGIMVVFGLGLLLRIEFLRAIAHFVAWVVIVLTAINILFSIGFIVLFPLAGILMVLKGLVDIVVAGLLIYVIGETGGFSPI